MKYFKPQSHIEILAFFRKNEVKCFLKHFVLCFCAVQKTHKPKK